MHALRLVPLLLASSLTMACGDIELPLNLEVSEDSVIELNFPSFPPPNDVAQTTLVGGVETTVAVDISLLDLILNKGFLATIVVDDVDIAGESIVIGNILPTGTICVSDRPSNPGGGMALLQPIQERAQVALDLFTDIRPTDPGIVQLLGGEPFPFDVSIEKEIPLSFADLIGLLGGGGGGAFTLSETLSTTLPPDVPIVGGAPVVADVTLSSVDEIADDPLLLDCAAF